MKYIFRGGNEFIKLKIDRANKKFEAAMSSTNYRFIPRPYYELFGNRETRFGKVIPATAEEMKKDMEEKESLSDEEFEQYLINDFRKIGYELKSKK